MESLTKNKHLVYAAIAAGVAYYFLVYKKKAAATPKATVLTPSAQ